MLLSCILYSLLCSFTLAASADDWRTRSIYQLITDRFATSDDKGEECDTNARAYCGGSWKGITDHLDYIQNMGFDAIWISPVNANIEGNTTSGEAFHGYWTQDLTSLNPHFGSPTDLQALSAAVHARGMFLMLDIVVNHFASTSVPPALSFSSYPLLPNASNYHPLCWISFSPTAIQDQTQVEQCWLGDKDLPLPDINTEDPTVVEVMYKWIEGLVKETGADGVRIDTVKHVRKDFWPGFGKAAGVFTIGEVFTNETSYAAPYTEVLDAILDYPTYFPLAEAFSSPLGNLSSLVKIAQASQVSYKGGNVGMVGSFLENHDQPRFASLTADPALVHNAMAWPFINDGIPIMYYGQEQGYQGGGDPYNREALWLSGYEADKPLVSFAKTLNAVRKAAINASNKFLRTPTKFLQSSKSSPHALVLSKPPLLALLTNSGTNGTASWDISGSGIFQNGEALVEVLTCKTVRSDEHGGLGVRNAVNGMPQILIPASALSNTGSLCPEVATGTGKAHGTVGGKGREGHAVTGTAGESARRVSWAALFGSAALVFVVSVAVIMREVV